MDPTELYPNQMYRLYGQITVSVNPAIFELERISYIFCQNESKINIPRSYFGNS